MRLAAGTDLPTRVLVLQTKELRQSMVNQSARRAWQLARLHGDIKDAAGCRSCDNKHSHKKAKRFGHSKKCTDAASCRRGAKNCRGLCFIQRYARAESLTIVCRSVCAKRSHSRHQHHQRRAYCAIGMTSLGLLLKTSKPVIKSTKRPMKPALHVRLRWTKSRDNLDFSRKDGPGK